MQDISSRMDAVCRRFEELSMRLNQPDAAADPALFRKLMREYHDTEIGRAHGLNSSHSRKSRMPSSA